MFGLKTSTTLLDRFSALDAEKMLLLAITEDKCFITEVIASCLTDLPHGLKASTSDSIVTISQLHRRYCDFDM